MTLKSEEIIVEELERVLNTKFWSPNSEKKISYTKGTLVSIFGFIIFFLISNFFFRQFLVIFWLSDVIFSATVGGKGLGGVPLESPCRDESNSV